MDNTTIQLSKAIENTYITDFLLHKQLYNSSLINNYPFQSYRNQSLQLITNTQYIKKYYSKNESIKYLLMIKLNLVNHWI